MIQKSESPTGAELTQGAGTAQDHCSAEQRLLPRLDGVRQTGPDTWMARCPAHDDRNPSLSIKHADDMLLINCFAGCEQGEIIAAVDLKMSDLFDKPLNHASKPLSTFQRKRHDQAREALKALTHECRVVGVLAEQMAAGFALDPSERDRLKVAIRRVANAQEIAG